MKNESGKRVQLLEELERLRNQIDELKDTKEWNKNEIELHRTLSEIISRVVERTKTEEALDESGEKYRTLFELGNDVILTAVPPDGKIMDVNEAAVRVLGYSKEELRKLSVWQIVAPEVIKETNREWLRQVKEKGYFLLETIWVRKDGSCIPVEISGKPFELKGQSLFQLSGRDITDRSKAGDVFQHVYKLQTVQYRIVEAVGDAENLDVLFHSIHQCLEDVMDTTNFYIAFYDSEKELLSFPYFVDEMDVQPKPKKPGNGLTEYVLRSGKSLIVKKEDIYNLKEQGEIELIGSVSEVWLGVPLKVKGKTVGAVAVQSYTDPVLYTEKDLEVLEFVSSQIADVVTHKQAEDALRESEEKFRSISSLAQDAIIMIDEEGKVSYWNTAAERIYSYKEQEVLGKELHKLIVPSRYRKMFYEGFKTFRKTGKGNAIGKTLELESVRKDGQEFPVGISLSAVKIKGNWNAIGIVRDISERKQAEEAIRKSEEKLHAICSTEGEGVLVVDNECRLSFMNPAAERILSWSEEELVDKNIHEVIHFQNDSGTEISFEECPIVNAVKAGEVYKNHDDIFINKNKDIVPIAYVIRPIVEEGETMGSVMSFHNIKKRKEIVGVLKKSEEKYRTLSQELASANSMKELLLDVITHDLKNPAGVISGMSEIMLEENAEDEMSQIIYDSSESLLKVIENASLLAKVTMGEEINKKEMDLAQIIEEVVYAFTPFLEDSGMRVDYHFDTSLVVQANPIISEVFKNYISNAIKYASEGKRIIIEAEKNNDFITVAVKDFGRMIPEKDHERIFHRRTQLKKGSKMGRGLGLAIVKRIAIAHSAEVWVEPNKPKGNIFYLKIPRAQNS